VNSLLSIFLSQKYLWFQYKSSWNKHTNRGEMLKQNKGDFNGGRQYSYVDKVFVKENFRHKCTQIYMCIQTNTHKIYSLEKGINCIDQILSISMIWCLNNFLFYIRQEKLVTNTLFKFYTFCKFCFYFNQNTNIKINIVMFN